MINTRQILSGILILLIGTLVYLIDRPPGPTLFLSLLPVPISLYQVYPPLFGPLGNVLPEFAHVVAFILLTGGILNCGRRWYPMICLFWLVVDGAFELGQKYGSRVAGLVADWFGRGFLPRCVGNYFKNGTYSNADMIAITVGAVAAYLILIYSQDKRRTS